MNIRSAANFLNPLVLADGIYIVFDNATRALLNESVMGYCADIRNPDCFDSIASVYATEGGNTLIRRLLLNISDIPGPKALFGWVPNLETLNVWIYGVGLFFYTINFLMASFRQKIDDRHDNIGVPSQLHLDIAQLKSLKSASNASVLVLATGPDDPNAYHLLLNTTTSTDIIAKNGTEGILILAVPFNAAVLDHFYNNMTPCPNPPPGLNKRRLNDCLLRLAQAFIEALGPDHPLNQLLALAIAVEMISPPKKFK